MTEIDQPYPAEPSYKVLKTLIDEKDENGQFQTLKLVKLGHTHVARILGKREYVDVDYVAAGAARLTQEDEHGTFFYEESVAIASDEDGTEHHAYLYFGPRALTLEEIMFTIGEM